MLENLNNSLFYFINATPDSAQWTISLAIFIAKDLINIVPLLAVVLWLWGPRDRVCAQRQLIWQWYGAPLYQALQRCYRFCFALPIRKGWVRD
ncbi:hypothetical protein C0020_12655 [Salmonella enterica]|nr:hypothetical protein [Salmonella enterica]EDO3748406.1 hypothetical protein [Salmonella enterica]EDX6349133.1 hypothetical protein [Salmonella enterica subsp. enterica serovar Javiana]